MFFKAMSFISSVALFLFSVKLLGEGLESAAKTRLKDIMGHLTKNKISSVVAGTFLTIIIQFSSATTIMTVGMVNSNIINLAQAAGLILGANLGTTIKSQILVFNPQVLVPFLIIIGTILYLSSNEKSKKDISYIFMGCALVVVSIEMISNSVVSLNSSDSFKYLLDAMGQNHLYAFFLGIAFTVLFQSSSAVMAILIALSLKGSITPNLAFPIILGANIGSVSPTLISAFKTSRDAKRAALIHLLINLIGAIIFYPLSPVILKLSGWLSPMGSSGIQIANMHTIYNLLSVIIFYPFINQLIKLSGIIIGERNKEIELTNSNILDKRLMNSPTYAETQIIQQTIRMSEFVKENVRLSFEALIDSDTSSLDRYKTNREYLKYISTQVKGFLIKLSTSEIGEKDQTKINASHNLIIDLEKMSDKADNLIELAQENVNNENNFSIDAKNEIKGLFSYVMEGLNIAFDSYRNSDKNLASTIYNIEDHINKMEKEYRDSHIQRLNRGKCTAISGVIFLEAISNLERIGDRATNFSENVIKYLR